MNGNTKKDRKKCKMSKIDKEVLQKPLETIIKAQRQFQEYLSLPLFQIQEEMQKMRKSLEPIFQFQQQLQENLKKILEPVIQFQKFAKQIEETRKIEKEVMIESGWWFTPSIMEIPANWINQATYEYKKGKKVAITNLFKKAYQGNNCQYLKKIIEEWNKNLFFQSSMKIIRDALKAHCDKKYTLSVPALLLVVEGIATDYCKKVKIYKKSYKSNSGVKIKKALEYYEKKIEQPIWLSDLDCVENAINEIIYADTDVLKRKKIFYKNILNRHAILHGLKKNYGTLKNSLQSFMLLDVLSQLK